MCEDTDSYLSLANVLVTEVKKLAPVFHASILSEDLDRYNVICEIVVYHSTERYFDVLNFLFRYFELEYQSSFVFKPLGSNTDIFYSIFQYTAGETVQLAL